MNGRGQITQADVMSVANLMALAAIDRTVRLSFDEKTMQLTAKEGKVGSYETKEAHETSLMAIYQTIKSLSPDYAESHPKLNKDVKVALTEGYEDMINCFIALTSRSLPQNAEDTQKFTQLLDMFISQSELFQAGLLRFEGSDMVAKQQKDVLNACDIAQEIIESGKTLTEEDIQIIGGTLMGIQTYVHNISSQGDRFIDGDLFLPMPEADNIRKQDLKKEKELRTALLQKEIGRFSNIFNDLNKAMEEYHAQVNFHEEESSPEPHSHRGYRMDTEDGPEDRL